MKLYEITTEISKLINQYNSVETEEQLIELEKKLTDISVTFKDKAVSVAHHIINTDSTIESIEVEIERLKTHLNHYQKEAEWFKRYLQNSMESAKETEIITPTMKLKIKNNPPSLIIDDENLIPDKYKKEVTTITVDKAAIKNEFKNGVGVNGTHLETKTRLEIK